MLGVFTCLVFFQSLGKHYLLADGDRVGGSSFTESILLHR
jgi:hypothetical protein